MRRPEIVNRIREVIRRVAPEMCIRDSGYSVGDPPLPIPNREVKPNHVDGTA